MKKSLKRKITVMLFAFVVLMNIAATTLNYRNFVAVNAQSSFDMASTVAETCALILDANKLNSYVQTGRRDSNYYEMWNKLIDYRNTNKDITRLSVVWFDEKGMHYIFDTNLEEEGAFLGDYQQMDQSQYACRSELIQGNPVECIVYKNRMDVYRPILSSYNIPIGYVVVGISTLEAQNRQTAYLMKLIVFMCMLTFLLAVIMIRIMTDSVIKPINRLSEATANYVKMLDTKTQESSLSHLSIHTGDEIENLFISIRKMESDLLHASDSLTIATWNSNHDSMTQLYNKRYLNACLEKLDGQDGVGVFYFDVDNLKKMNDLCGHENGDRVILQAAAFIRKYEEQDGLAFRIGGDEFLMIVQGKTQDEIRQLAEMMRSDPCKRLTEEGEAVCCHLAIGFAYSAGQTDMERLIEDADQSMYLDKQSHRE